MRGLTNSITNRQLFFILFLTLTAYTTIDLPKIMAQTSGRSSWIPILGVAILVGISAVFVTKLNNMFLGKVFFDYSQEIVGKFFAYLITSYYLLFYIVFCIYLKLKLAGLLKSNFLPTTPKAVALFVVILLVGYVAYKGITNIARLFEIIGFFFLITTVGLCLYMLVEGTKFNIMPFFTTTEAKEFLFTVKDLATPYIGITVLFVIPFSPINKKAPKVAFFTLLFVGLLYVLIVESTFMILGLNNTLTMNDSFIEAVKIVEMPVIERTDIFYLTFGLSSLFAGMIMVFTVIVEFACRLFPKVKRVIIVIAFDILIYILTLFALKIENMKVVFESFMPYIVFTTILLIPISLFIIAKVKKWAAGQNSG